MDIKGLSLGKLMIAMIFISGCASVQSVQQTTDGYLLGVGSLCINIQEPWRMSETRRLRYYKENNPKEVLAVFGQSNDPYGYYWMVIYDVKDELETIKNAIQNEDSFRRFIVERHNTDKLYIEKDLDKFKKYSDDWAEIYSINGIHLFSYGIRIVNGVAIEIECHAMEKNINDVYNALDRLHVVR